MKVGDLVKHVGRHEYPFWAGKFGIVAAVRRCDMRSGEPTVFTTQVHWFDDDVIETLGKRPHWFDPEYLEVANESR